MGGINHVTMCGIVGIIHRDPDRVADEALLARMTGLVEARGPDGRGLWRCAPAALGFRRLAIIGGQGGGQPLLNETGRVALVCNGEIYNHRDLRRRLEALGHRFAGTSDAEVIVHGYEEWGMDVATHLRGMFAFGLWDGDRRRLVLARDRFGKKPLFHAIVRRGLPDEALIFASSLPALLAHPDLPRRVRPRAVEEFLAFTYVPEPGTILEDVAQVRAAHVLVYGDGAADESRYWDLDYEPKPPVTEEEAEEAVRAALDEAVSVRLESEAPLGYLLSAGIDSAAVAAVARRHTDGPMRTFTGCMAGARFDERDGARAVARMLGARHHELVIEPDPAECLSLIPWHYGQPNAHRAAVAYLYLYRWVARHVRVVLSGDGGDELFAGYERHVRLNGFDRWRRRLPAPLRWAARSLADSLGDAMPDSGALSHLRLGLRSSLMDTDALFVQSYICFLDWQRPHVLTPEFLRTSRADDAPPPEEAYWRFLRAAVPASPLDRRTRAETLVMMPALTLTRADSLGMAHALEVRSPFLDHHLAEYAARLPADMKLRDGQLKWMLKRALRGTVPDEILAGRKIGFGMAGGDYLMAALRSHGPALLLDATARARGIINTRHAEALIRQHRGGGGRHHHRLWSLLILEAWLRTFIDRTDPAAAGPMDFSGV